MKMERAKMVEFLRDHQRYWTANSWNRSTSYSARVKIHDFVPRTLQAQAYKMLEMREVYAEIGDRLLDFNDENKPYSIGFNGRSSGYLVLYYDTYPLRSIDQHAEYEDMDDDDLKNRYALVKAFDQAVIDCKAIFLRYCRHYKVEEKEVLVKKTVKVLVGK